MGFFYFFSNMLWEILIDRVFEHSQDTKAKFLLQHYLPRPEYHEGHNIPDDPCQDHVLGVLEGPAHQDYGEDQRE